MADENTYLYSGDLSEDDLLLLNSYGSRGVPKIEDFSVDMKEPEVPVQPEVAVPASELVSQYRSGFERPLETAEKEDQAEDWAERRRAFYEDAINEGRSQKEAIEESRIRANGSMLTGQYGVYDRPDEQLTGETGVTVAVSKALGGRRAIDIQRRPTDPETGQTQDISAANIQDRRDSAKEFQKILETEGLFAAGKKAFSSKPMTLDEAKEVGIGAGRQTFFGRDQEAEDEQEGFYIPYGIKNLDALAERAAVKAMIPSMFANLFLDDDEMEAYLKEYRNVVPTQNFSALVEKVESSKEQGMTESEIEQELMPEISSILLMQTYEDLPAAFQLEKPSVSKFKSFLESNPEAFSETRDSALFETIKAVDLGESDKEIQKKLNAVAFGSLPEEVWAGSTGSPRAALKEAVRAAGRVIEAKGRGGKVGRALATTVASPMFTQEKIQDEYMVVESTIGKIFRSLGVFTEGAAEARLPFDIPITPASRDFYYDLGIRGQDSTWLARMLANIETGNIGFMMHATDEARARGYKEGEGGFQAALFLGGALDFLIPWEKFHFSPAAHTVKGASRGAYLVRTVGAKGFKQRAFLAGYSPKVYDMIYRVHERSTMSFNRLSDQLPVNPKVGDIDRLMAQDDAAQTAKAQGLPRTTDEQGNEIVAMSLQDRDYLDQLSRKMKQGESFIDAAESLKSDFKPNVFDTAADAAMAVVKHLVETDEAGTIFKKSGRDPNGVIPFEMDIQVQRTLAAAGFDPAEVINIVRKRTNSNREAYLQSLRVLSKTGDDDTVDLRSSPEYVSFRKKLDDLVESGDLLDEEKIVLLNIMETRAYNAAGLDKIKTIKEPSDFFKQAKVEKVQGKLEDGSDGPSSIKVKSGKIFEIDQSDVVDFIDFLKSDDMISINRLLDNDQSLLVALMGKGWVDSFTKNSFKRETNPNPQSKLPKTRLTDEGKIEVERVLRSLFDAEGNLSAQKSNAKQLFENMTAVYARMDEKLKKAMIPETKKAMLDTTLRPDRFFRNGLIERNMRQSYVPGSTVRTAADDMQVLQEGLVAKTGRKRVFSDVDVNPDYVRQGLGLTEDTVEVDAVDLYARSIGYVLGETMKMKEATALFRGMDIVRLTPASFARRDQVKSIRKRVNAKMASVLGIKKHSTISKGEFLDAKQLKAMADPESSTLQLNEAQQAQFKVFLQQLASEPIVGTKIPNNLMGAGADLERVSFLDYNRVIELLMDVEAGVHARRTVYTEAIPRSLAYSLLNTFRSTAIDVASRSEIVGDVIKGIESRFNLDDPLSSVRPEFKELFQRHLSEVGLVRDEVIQLVRSARREKPDIAIEAIFDKLRNNLEADMRIEKEQVRLLMGEADLVYGSPHKKGLLDIISKFTDAEKKRIETLAGVEDEVDFQPMQPSERKIAAGADVREQAAVPTSQLVEDTFALPGTLRDPDAAAYVPIAEGESRLQYLTKTSTREQLQYLCRSFGGINGLTKQTDVALSILERFTTESGITDVSKLTDENRVVLGQALFKIQEQLEQQKRYVVQRGSDILESLGGSRAQLNKADDVVLSTAYILFHEGGEGWKNLLLYAAGRGKDLGFDPDKISKYSPAQAYLEMVVRMMARNKLQNMFDDMIRVGMPGANENYRIPKAVVTPMNAKYSIDAPHAFYDRVKGYMNSIFNESQDVSEIKKLEDGSTRPVEPVLPTGEGFDYRFAPYEKKGRRTFRHGQSFQDLEARIAAEEVLVRFGMRSRSAEDGLTMIEFPDGSQTYGPKGLADELQNALNRAANIGAAYGTKSAMVLDPATVGTPYVDIPKTARVKTYTGLADAVTALAKFFPITFANIKRGITTGLFVPNPAYYTANFMGGALQLMTAVDPIKATGMLIKNPRMTLAVVSRMFGEGTYKPSPNHMIISKNGMIYNADQITEMAMQYRLNSSFIQAETQRGMADDIKKYIRENQTLTSNKIVDFASAWNDQLAECATAIDNFYRVSIFIDGLNDGVSPVQASNLAKRAAFDYGALTDFEKRVMRDTIMFYSYMRKNMDLFMDTLLTNPSRVTNQLRVTNGIHRANMEEDPQVVLPGYQQERLAGAFKQALFNKHAYDQRMYIIPPIPIMDSVNIFMDVYDAFKGDEEAERMLFTRLVPWAQLPVVWALDVDPFYGQELSRFQKVPQHFLEWDLAVTGGMLRRQLDVQLYTPRNQRLRLVEGDDDRQMYLAKNGELWWAIRNIVQIPGLGGRSMVILEQADRANMGVVEFVTEVLQNGRMFLENADLVDKVSDDFLKGDTASPRVGLTEFDEMLAIFGVRAINVKNLEQVRRELRKENNRNFKKLHPISQNKYEQRKEKEIRVKRD